MDAWMYVYIKINSFLFILIRNEFLLVLYSSEFFAMEEVITFFQKPRGC